MAPSSTASTGVHQHAVVAVVLVVVLGVFVVVVFVVIVDMFVVFVVIVDVSVVIVVVAVVDVFVDMFVVVVVDPLRVAVQLLPWHRGQSSPPLGRPD